MQDYYEELERIVEVMAGNGLSNDRIIEKIITIVETILENDEVIEMLRENKLAEELKKCQTK